MHLLLLQLAAFLIEQVGILIDKVQVVARSDGHRVTTSLSQTVVSLFKVDKNLLSTYQQTVTCINLALKDFRKLINCHCQPGNIPGGVFGVQTHNR